MSEKRRERDQKEHKMIQKYKKEEIDKIKIWVGPDPKQLVP